MTEGASRWIEADLDVFRAFVDNTDTLDAHAKDALFAITRLSSKEGINDLARWLATLDQARNQCVRNHAETLQAEARVARLREALAKIEGHLRYAPPLTCDRCVALKLAVLARRDAALEA